MKKPTIGLAVLGFQGYSPGHCKKVLRFFRGAERKVLAYLDSSFGTDTKNLLRWYAQCDENSVTQVYISNEVDRRKSRIDKGNF